MRVGAGDSGGESDSFVSVGEQNDDVGEEVRVEELLKSPVVLIGVIFGWEDINS